MPTPARGYPTSGWRSGAAAYGSTFGRAAAASRAVAVPSSMVGMPRLPPVGPLAPIAGAALTAWAIWEIGKGAWDFYNWYTSSKSQSPPVFKPATDPNGWVLQCGALGGQYSNSYPNGCPIDPNHLVVSGSGMPNTGPGYNGVFGEWICRTWDDIPGNPSSQTIPDTITRVREVGYWTNSTKPSTWNVVRPGAPTYALPLDPVAVTQDMRAAFLEALEMTEALSVRGYDAPIARDLVVVEPLREDAYAANPGRTFVWEVSAAGIKGVRPVSPPLVIPGVNAPPIPGVRPIPGSVVQVVPGGATVVQPAVGSQPLFPARPAPFVKERKAKMSIAGQASLIPGGMAGLRFFNLATETCDAVDALWKAIPFKEKLRHGWVKRLPKGARFKANGGKPRPDIQLKDNREKSYAFNTEKFKPGEGQSQKFFERRFSEPGCLRKAKIIASGGWHYMDTTKAFWNLVEEQVQDTVIGMVAGAAVKAHSKVQRRIRSKGASPVLGPAL